MKCVWKRKEEGKFVKFYTACNMHFSFCVNFGEDDRYYLGKISYKYCPECGNEILQISSKEEKHVTKKVEKNSIAQSLKNL